jgi:hypothetical protein
MLRAYAKHIHFTVALCSFARSLRGSLLVDQKQQQLTFFPDSLARRIEDAEGENTIKKAVICGF